MHRRFNLGENGKSNVARQKKKTITWLRNFV